MPVADTRGGAQGPKRIEHVNVDDPAIGKHGKVHRLVEGLNQLAHLGLGKFPQAFKFMINFGEVSKLAAHTVAVAVDVMIKKTCCR